MLVSPRQGAEKSWSTLQDLCLKLEFERRGLETAGGNIYGWELNRLAQKAAVDAQVNTGHET